ncbi:cysteine hydrolase family protein [Streptococcus cuniculipharyngis]|uniref:Cysteine hydrolase n=1 Tax=Streptococcus cuniculipharyngis TaxID=1562651 RepID=A0A5C5SD31_9STRE|nr:isochorismatase family cysteine hydrolase [Streptococcus cuniculipharyngis]TWS98192.1 cysteine hydrolase [Streptococcus cuniculipharyngis]
MKKALISIDYTVDFVADEGRLTAGQPAQAIESAICQFSRAAYEAGHLLVFAIDGHDEKDSYHPESRLFPPHNLMGSQGRQLYGELGRFYDQVKTAANVLWLDKRYYSAFAGTSLNARLRERGVDTVILTGVLTDICVLHTAVDAYNLGYQIEIPVSAVATLTPERQAWALEHFQTVLGARLID